MTGDERAAPGPEAPGAAPYSGPGLTITDGAAAMTPPMPRRELARRLAAVRPVGTSYGRRGRRAKTYPVTAILRAHADWVRETHSEG